MNGIKKLYLIKRKLGTVDYDEYDSAVVCAESVDDARATHPSGDNNDWDEPLGSWLISPNDVEYVNYLGLADESVEIGVVCASFNAG